MTKGNMLALAGELTALGLDSRHKRWKKKELPQTMPALQGNLPFFAQAASQFWTRDSHSRTGRHSSQLGPWAFA